MELNVKPYHKNNFPLQGMLLKQASVSYWIAEIQRMNLALNEVELYAIPGNTANSVWGCFVLPLVKVNKELIGKHELCQQVSVNFFIPERSILYPAMTTSEIEKLFHTHKHIIHPEFGLVELMETVNVKALLQEPQLKSYTVIQPEPPVFIPRKVNSFQVEPVSPEEVMRNLEENVFPKSEKMEDKPLSLFEKAKLSLYKTLLPGKGTKQDAAGNPIAGEEEGSGIWNKLKAMLQKTLSDKDNAWANKLQKDYEDLEKRNQKEIDKLLDLLKNNPEEALRYAIPLDNEGTSRGGENTHLNLSKRWNDFSLFSNYQSARQGSGSINLGDHFHELQKQYNSTAEELIKQKEFQKAAFVYMKLLKNQYKAGETLETGKHYQEAATVFLKHANDKNRAAQCYEKGNMINNAIELYKDLNENEKVGDLYMNIHKTKEAFVYFEKVADAYKEKNQYVKASLIYKEKMNNGLAGQSMLMEGWRNNMDSLNCLHTYFSNIEDVKELHKEINTIYKNDVSEVNREQFLEVIRKEYSKGNELREPIKEMAYEIISEHVVNHPSIINRLKEFNVNDKELVKDTLRFTLNRKNK